MRGGLRSRTAALFALAVLAACRHDFLPDSRWTVSVGWGGEPGGNAGCVLTREEPKGTFKLSSPGFYDAARPGRAAFHCPHEDVGLVVKGPDRVVIEGPRSVAAHARFTLSARVIAGGDEIDLGKYGGLEWTYSGAIEKAEGCHEGGLFGGACDDAQHQFVRALDPGIGHAQVKLGGLTASFAITVQ